MTEKPKSYLAEMSTKVVKYLSKIHRKYRKVKVQSLPFIIEFDVKEKVSDLIIEFQLATNPFTSLAATSLSLSPKRKRWLIMHSKWEGSSLRIFSNLYPMVHGIQARGHFSLFFPLYSSWMYNFCCQEFVISNFLYHSAENRTSFEH